MVRVHSIQPKALSASAFSLSYRVLGRLHRPLPLAGEPPFGLHAALCANTFARLLLSESTHKAKSTQSECFFFCLIVSLDDCIVHCLWQANHLSVCTLRFCKYICPLAVGRVHSIILIFDKTPEFFCKIRENDIIF